MKKNPKICQKLKKKAKRWQNIDKNANMPNKHKKLAKNGKHGQKLQTCKKLAKNDKTWAKEIHKIDKKGN